MRTTMERCHKSLWLAGTSVPALLLAATIGRGLAASQPVAGSPCLRGTYVVKGRSLLPSDMERGNDAVVLEIAGDAEGTPPLVTVRSGCAAGPATLASKQNHTVVTAELSACGAVEATARLRARIDASCQTMRGRFRARHAGKGSTVRRCAARRGAGCRAAVTR